MSFRAFNQALNSCETTGHPFEEPLGSEMAGVRSISTTHTPVPYIYSGIRSELLGILRERPLRGSFSEDRRQ